MAENIKISAMTASPGAADSDVTVVVKSGVNYKQSNAQADALTLTKLSAGPGISYNSGTGVISVALSGTYNISISGNAATATALLNARNINGASFDGTSSISVPANTQTTSTSGARFVGFYNSNSNGNQTTQVNAGLTFDPSTGNLTSTTFTGTLSGNALTATTALNVNNNLIVAGNFTTNPWQRGVSGFTPDSDGVNFSADRFALQAFSSHGDFTVDKYNDAPTFSQCNVVTSDSLRTTVTIAQPALESDEGYCINYNLRVQEWMQIAYQSFTVSFWVKSNLTGTYCMFFLDTNSVTPHYDTYISEFTINSANTWEKKTITVSASPSSYTYNNLVWLGFCLGAGTDVQGVANTWGVNSNDRCTSNQVNFMQTLGNTFQIDLLQIEPGNIATPYINYPQDYVINHCQGEFEKSYSQGTDPATASTVGMIAIDTGTATTNNLSQSVTYKVEKNSSPTITLYDAAGNTGKVTKGGNSKNGTTTNGGTRGFTGSSSDSTSSSSMTFHWTASTGY